MSFDSEDSERQLKLSEEQSQLDSEEPDDSLTCHQQNCIAHFS